MSDNLTKKRAVVSILFSTCNHLISPNAIVTYFFSKRSINRAKERILDCDEMSVKHYFEK